MNLRYLIDTYILVNLVHTGTVDNAIVVAALRKLTMAGAQCFIVPQIVNEFHAFLLKSKEDGGFGLLPNDIDTTVTALLMSFEMLPDTPALSKEWSRLGTCYATRGHSTDHARLVAAMKVHGLTHVLTTDAIAFEHFETGENIIAVEPASV